MKAYHSKKASHLPSIFSKRVPLANTNKANMETVVLVKLRTAIGVSEPLNLSVLLFKIDAQIKR